MRNHISALLLGSLLSPGLLAQGAPDVGSRVAQFQATHPGSTIDGARFHSKQNALDEVGTTSVIYGTTLSIGASPIDSARNHLIEVRGLLAEEHGALIPELRGDGEVILEVMFDRQTGLYGFSTFRFAQVHGNVPVFRSGAGFLVRNEPGYPLVMSAFDVKDLAGFEASALVGPVAQDVTNSMLEATRQLLDEEFAERGVSLPAPGLEIETSEERLVIWAGVNGSIASPELAMEFLATRGSDLVSAESFQRQRVLVSVATNEVLYSENLVQNFIDVTGNVSGRATQGLNSLECDPEVLVPLPYIEANVVGGNSTFADGNGDFTIPHGGAAAVTVQSRLRGLYFEVFDDINGQTIPQVSVGVTPPGPANLVHNPTPNQEHPTAGVNAYLEANRVRDYTLFYAPNFPTIDTEQFFDIIVNEDNFSGITSCNAVYTGSSMVFWRNAGGCNNTAFTDVVHHEYGHHLINVTGNGQGQLGEGSGDCMGVLIQDDPVLGQGFQTCNQGIRNANNNHQYPCNGGIHDCGQLISGCVWDLRNELIVTEPLNYRDIGASLFVNMLMVRGQMFPGNSTIDPQITVIYLTLDDDNGTIGDGTPHYTEIAAGFGAHNMDAPPLQLIGFDYPTGRPDNIDPAGGQVEFTVEVVGITGSPAPGTGVLHLDRGNGIENFPMNQASANVYEVVFPAVDCGTTASYYFSAQASSGATQTDPPNAPTGLYGTISATSLTVAHVDDFESNMGWSVSGDATDGQWNRGTPAGGGDRGDPPSDADGSGQCFLTDNVDGNSDVDGGSTIATSPPLDAVTGNAGGEALISYHRWYSNTFGGDPENDIFVVEISNDLGANWTNLETVGPNGPEVDGGWYEKTFRISDFLPPSTLMLLRFTASDLSTGSVVEAGIDGIRIVFAGCEADCNGNGTVDSLDIAIGTSNDANGNGIPDECEGLATNYCSTAPNSVDGTGAIMSSTGSFVIADNNMSLSASPVPNTFGQFFYGPIQTNQPFGAGFRCVANPIFRLEPPAAAAGNTATRVLDFFGSGNENLILPGDTMNFQYWYRDPAGGLPPNDFNLSDGLQVTFQL